MALYEIAVSVDLGDAGHALRVAAAADTAGLSPARQARMLVDVARAFALRDQVTEAVAALLSAESVSASYVHASDRAAQVVRDLIGLRDPPPAELTRLAARLADPPAS